MSFTDSPGGVMLPTTRHSRGMALDWDNWLTKLPEATRMDVTLGLRGPDPDEERRNMTDLQFLYERTGIPMALLNEDLNKSRGDYAAAVGWEGARDKAVFRARMTDELAHDRDEEVMISGTDDDTEQGARLRKDSMQGFAYDAGIQNASRDTSTKRKADAFDAYVQWQGEARNSPAYRPRNAPQYLKNFLAVYQLSLTDQKEADAAFKEVQTLLATMPNWRKTGDEASFDKAAAIVEGLNPRARGMAMEKIAAWKPAKIDSQGLGSDVNSAMERGLFDLKRMVGGAIDKATSAGGEAEEKISRLQRTRQQLVNVALGKIDPLSKDRWWEMALTGAAGTLPAMATAMIPVLGPTALAMGYTSDAQNSLIEKGVPFRQASTLGAFIGPAQAAADMVQVSLLTKMPGLKSLLQKWSGNAGAAFLGRVAGVTASETAVEIAQDQLIPALVQDVGSVWDDHVPGVKWAEVAKEAWAQTPELLLTMLPLALLGAGAAHVNDVKAADQLARNPEALRLLGFKAEHIAAIELSAPEDAVRTLRSLWGERVPVTKGAGISEATAELSGDRHGVQGEPATGVDGLHETPGAGNADLEAEANAAAGVSRMWRDNDGWHLEREDGAVAHVGSLEAAHHLREDMAMARSAEEAQALVDVTDWISQQDPKTETSFTGAAVEAQRGPGGTVVKSLDAKGALKILNFSKETLANLDAELEMLGVDRAGINGRNWLADDVRKLEINQTPEGVATVLHERFESLIRAGNVTETEMVVAARAVTHFFDPATAKTPEAKSLAQRIQNIASGKTTETEARETLVELTTADVIGRRDKLDVPAGAISAGVRSAISRTVDGKERKLLGKVAAFLKAARTYARGLLGTAVKLRKARREGKDLKDFDAFVDKLVGRDADRAHTEAVMDEAVKELGIDPEATKTPNPNNDTAAEGYRLDEGESAFSLSPGATLDRFADEIQARLARDPEARLRVAEKAKENLRRVKERVADRVVEKKTVRQLDFEEKALRESLEAQYVAEAEAGLTDAAQAALAQKPSIFDHSLAPVLDAVLQPQKRKNGRLQTLPFGRFAPKSSATGGEYDGAEGLPSWLFRGAIAPDRMVEELGMGSVDQMWDAIREELATVRNLKEAKAAAEATHKELTGLAKERAFIDAFSWRREQDQMQKEDWNPRDALIRDLTTLDAIIAALPKEIRGSVGGFVALARLATNEARTDEISARIEKIDRLLERHLAGEYSDRLDTLFRRGKAKGDAGEKLKGKIGAEAHKLLAQMEAAQKWDAPTVAGHLAGLNEAIISGDLSAEDEARKMLEMQLVELAGDWRNADAARRAAALSAAEAVYESGYQEQIHRLLKQREERSAARTALMADTGKAGTKTERDARAEKDMGWKGKIKDIFLGLSSFDEVSRYAFGESATARTFVDRERAASNQKEDAVQAVSDAVADLFTAIAGTPYKGTEAHWKLAEKHIDAGKGGKLSELEIVQASLMWRQEDGQRHMEAAGFDGEWMKAMEAKLSADAKAVRAFLVAQYSAEYGPLNALYRERHGVDLPSHENYAPLTVKPMQVKGGQIEDPVTGQAIGNSLLTPGSLRTRSRVATAEPDFRDALQTYLGHVRQLEHWKAYYPLATDMQAIFGNRDLGNSIEAKGGEQAVKALRAWKDYFAQGGIRDSGAFLALNKKLNAAGGRAAEMILFGRAGTLMIQSTQLGAALAEMPTGSYIKRLGKLFAGKLGWKDAIKSEYIQRRLQQAPPIVRQAMDALAVSEPTRIKYAARQVGRLIAGADALFTAGTYAIALDYHRTQGGKSGLRGTELEAYARTEAERAVDRVAQPTRPGARSLTENTMTNPLARAGWAFASEARQKMAMAAWAATKNPKQFARTLAVVWGAGGLAAALIRTVWRDMRDDDDEEVFDERNWSAKRLISATLAGPFQGVPVFGELIETGINRAFGNYAPTSDIFGQAGDSFTAAKKLITGGTLSHTTESGRKIPNKEPVEDTLKAAKSVLFAMGLWNDTVAAANSLANLVEDGAKIADNLNGVEKR